MSRIVLFSGGGDYADPWHPFAETSPIVAGVLRDDGHAVTVVDGLDDLATALPDAELLVVNAGGGPAPHPLDDRLAAVLDGYAGAVLVLHVAATLLPEHPAWERLLGGRWVRGTSMHPARGPLRLRAAETDPLTAVLDPIDTVDEAYSWLRVGDDTRVRYVQDHAGEVHPAAWTVVRDGRRVAYNSLGHDAEAYESPAARELLRRLARWTLSD